MGSVCPLVGRCDSDDMIIGGFSSSHMATTSNMPRSTWTMPGKRNHRRTGMRACNLLWSYRIRMIHPSTPLMVGRREARLSSVEALSLCSHKFQSQRIDSTPTRETGVLPDSVNCGGCSVSPGRAEMCHLCRMTKQTSQPTSVLSRTRLESCGTVSRSKIRSSLSIAARQLTPVN